MSNKTIQADDDGWAEWLVHEGDFHNRLTDFERSISSNGNTLSIKIRVVGGCFHREHSTNAYAIIDPKVSDYRSREKYLRFIEHESGPEILVYLAAATAGTTLVAAVINLVTEIIKARSEGIKKGDHPYESLKLIIRKRKEEKDHTEETLLIMRQDDPIDFDLIKKLLTDADGGIRDISD